MSSVSSISASGVDVAQLLQRLAARRNAASADSTNASGGPGGSPPGDFQDKFGQALTAAGVSEEDAATIQSEVKSAIATALQNQDGSSESRDAVKTAIDDTLTKHGLDPETIRKQFESLFGGPGSAGGPGGGPPPGGPPPEQETDESSSTQTTGSTSSTSGTESLQSLLSRLLSSNEEDDGTTAQLLQSLLPLLDTTA